MIRSGTVKNHIGVAILTKRIKYTLKTLYIMECLDSVVYRIHTFYAKDETEAKQIVEKTLDKRIELTLIAVTPHPEGFIFRKFRRPGKIQILCKE